MPRPAGPDWAPLGLETDPVPGDPDLIWREEQHLRAVTKQIKDQVQMLRRIARADGQRGGHADRIRDTARELAGQLDTVAERYHNVASALRDWIPELEQAQELSLTALRQAVAPYETLRRLDAPDSLMPAEAEARQRTVQRAREELAAAHRLLRQATDLRDTQGSRYASRIRQARDDLTATRPGA